MARNSQSRPLAPEPSPTPGTNLDLSEEVVSHCGGQRTVPPPQLNNPHATDKENAVL